MINEVLFHGLNNVVDANVFPDGPLLQQKVLLIKK